MSTTYESQYRFEIETRGKRRKGNRKLKKNISIIKNIQNSHTRNRG